MPGILTASADDINIFVQQIPISALGEKAPGALFVCLLDGEDSLRHRPTQGWTVDEAWILLHRSIYSLTVQPWVGRWRIQPTYPRMQKVILKQYCFVAPRSLLIVPYAMKCFTTKGISIEVNPEQPFRLTSPVRGSGTVPGGCPGLFMVQE